ncbi:unnamed protein product [Phytophthora fragariaefolia]|uniref:Elicitin n=1 Tax=Phytophthora fragariaefolia TaxID=1490495 RepID=A0A9W6WPX2_9STRA|nr:unnamed protein product [Phytophthora fragariaefolia]
MLWLRSVVLVGLALVSPVIAEDCPTEALLGLASNTNLAACSAEAGVSVATISTLTDNQIKTICKSSSCLGLVSDVASLNLGDCTIPGSSITVQSDVLDRVAAACGESGSAVSGSTGSSGSFKTSGTNVGDDSSVGSSSGDSVVGGSTTGSSSASTATVSFGAAIFMASLVALL